MEAIAGCLLLLGTAYGISMGANYFETIIEEVNSGGAKWKAGHNFDPNTPISFIEGLMGAKKYPDSVQLRAQHLLLQDSEIPEEFDSREHWPYCPTIRQIRDQGNCGSCWAVAAAAVFSDRYCIATNGSFTLPLSDEELLSCCNLCGEGCNGGFPYVAWKYFKHYGIVTGGGHKSGVGCQPYEVQSCEHHSIGELPQCNSLPKTKTPKCQNECTNPSYDSPYVSDHRKVHSAYVVRRDVSEIQKEILLYGPVEAALRVYSDFTTYKSGVYHHVTGKNMGGHAVRIIGWGVEDGTPYWLVANSWNTHWGDKGLFKILRGEDHCGIESDVVAGIPLVD